MAAKWPKDNQPAMIKFFGNPATSEVADQLVKIVPPFTMYYEGKKVKTISFHKKGVAALEGALKKIWLYSGQDQALIDKHELSKYSGTYNPRLVRGSKTKWSNHAFAAAIDIDSEDNSFGTGKGDLPLWAIAAFKSEGFSWGGDYEKRTDPMHFELCDRGDPVRTFEQWLAFYKCAPLKQDVNEAPKEPKPFLAAIKPDFAAPEPKVEAPPIVPTTVQTVQEATVPSLAADKNAVRGDPDLWNTQRRLEEMKYFPGDLDGIWGGKTRDAISGFLADRHSTLTPPKTAPEFVDVLPSMKVELAEAESEQPPFTRPISVERAEATDAKVALVSDAIPAAKQSGFMAWLLGIPATILGAFSGIASYFQELWSNEGIVAMREFASDNIGYIAAALATLAVLQFLSAQRAKNATKEAYKEGRLS